jgi:hypothetical protein
MNRFNRRAGEAEQAKGGPAAKAAGGNSGKRPDGTAIPPNPSAPGSTQGHHN